MIVTYCLEILYTTGSEITRHFESRGDALREFRKSCNNRAIERLHLWLLQDGEAVKLIAECDYDFGTEMRNPS